MKKLSKKALRVHQAIFLLALALVAVVVCLGVVALRSNSTPASDNSVSHKATTSKYTNPSFIRYKQGVENCAQFGGPVPADSVIYANWKNKQPIGC